LPEELAEGMIEEAGERETMMAGREGEEAVRAERAAAAVDR
jgi:hypothetical protein